jgi:hypothetical protein
MPFYSLIRELSPMRIEQDNNNDNCSHDKRLRLGNSMYFCPGCGAVIKWGQVEKRW